jgi:hypothetical protein
MMLVSIPEFAQISGQLLRQQGTLQALKRTCEATANALDGYWRTQPDLESAAAEAVHDSNRYHVASLNAENALDYVLTALQSLANLTDGGCDEKEVETTVAPIIADAANKVGEALRIMREQLALRRDPTGKTKLEGTPNG